MSEILSLAGKVAFVSGAGQGVGRQVALHFAAHGCSAVLVNDFYADRAQAVAAEVDKLGSRGIAIEADVTDKTAVREALARGVEQAGGLHIVVNNAGNAGPQQDGLNNKPFWETDSSDWDKWLGTNLYGVLNVCHTAIPFMIRGNEGGSIVNVISDAGRVGEPGLVVYSAAKAGASGLSRALAKALGAHQIRVNAVSLATIATPTLEPLLRDPEQVRKMLRHYIIRRVGQPSDAANMVLFLAAEASSWITGQTFAVNGGYSVSQ